MLAAWRKNHPSLTRPMVLVAGALNDRVDFELIERCASLSEVGSIGLVGPIDVSCDDPALKRLRQHPKCYFVGMQPHHELPFWMQAADLALIPYRDTPLNRACSPMRLYDHLASGRQLIASGPCEGFETFRHLIHLARTADDAVRMVRQALLKPESENSCEIRSHVASENTWLQRAEVLAKIVLTNLGKARP
jgi:hypothetical protein